MISNEQEWNNALDELQASLKRLLSYATNAIGEAYLLRHSDYSGNPMQSEADYFDLCEYMDMVDKYNSSAQEILKRFYENKGQSE